MVLHRLGPFRLDTQDDLLLRGAEPVALGRRAVALLRALLERPGAVVSKDALITAAWHHQAVEESNLSVQIAALRRALGETPGGQSWIETVPRRGYRFIGPLVREESEHVAAAKGPAASGDQPSHHAAAVRSGDLALPDKPSIAVLPFQNMSGDPEQEYFVDGLVEDITSALSCIRQLFVIARLPSPTRDARSIFARSAASSVCATFSRGACASPARACALPVS